MDLYWMTNRLPPKLKTIHEKIKLMSGNIDATIQTVRRISTELRPGILDDLGLVAALEWQAHEFQHRTGIQCRVTSDLQEAILDEDLNTAFFRIFQETLTNIIRHANASRVDVSLKRESGNLVLEVRDNGRGISEAEISNTQSIGLLGMRERAALLGGEVTFKGVPEKGTTVRVAIPLIRPRSIEPRYHENSYRRRSRSRTSWLETNSRRRI
jgi:signal transduction histidine kinase